MRVQHNIPAMNSYRNYNNNAKAINKNLEKLSSGYRINRAGDDAAGLAISEKMRAQITGLEVAQKNAKDGISLVQTAEGALTEVHDMLNRMYALAEQAGNGTYDNSVDRVQLNKEVTKLREEIDRIGKTTNFNGTKLFDSAARLQAVATQPSAATTGITDVVATISTTDTGLNGKTMTVAESLEENDGATHTYFKITPPDGYTLDSDDGTAMNSYTFTDPSGTTTFMMSNSADSTKKTQITLDFSNFQPGPSITNGSITFTVPESANLQAGEYTAPTDVTAQSKSPTNVSLTGGGAIDLWVGDFPDNDNKIAVKLEDISSDALVITDQTVDLSSQESALNSLSYIKDAIDKVSDLRGTLGAAQNRLEHTINNLSVMQENIQDAESTIRDTDVAEEMMRYTKNSILVQSAQAMLAQANQQPQSVLQLLQ